MLPARGVVKVAMYSPTSVVPVNDNSGIDTVLPPPARVIGVPASKPVKVLVPVVEVLATTCETIQLPIEINDPPVTYPVPVSDEKDASAV